jgi:hypothetical protein
MTNDGALRPRGKSFSLAGLAIRPFIPYESTLAITMPRRKPRISISIVSTRLRVEECYAEDAQKLAAMPAHSSLIGVLAGSGVTK